MAAFTDGVYLELEIFASNNNSVAPSNKSFSNSIMCMCQKSTAKQESYSFVPLIKLSHLRSCLVMFHVSR